ncbi:MAG: L-threonylcarbamoyladenylate synthase [Patescibacteria group bacterium]
MWNDPNIVKVIKEGGIVVMPTDTVYGLVGGAHDSKAIERIYQIKNRQKDKKLINLISDWSETQKWGIDSSKFNIPVYDSPTTFILDGISFRVPQSSELITLLKQTGPLVAPSANPEGLPPAKNIMEAKKYFSDKVDLYIDGGEVVGKASEVIRLEADGTVTILRA